MSLGFGERLAGPPSVRAMLALGYLIVFGSLIAFSAYLFLLGRVRPALATSYAYVNPAVAVALGVGLAGEQITGAGVLALSPEARVGAWQAGRGRKSSSVNANPSASRAPNRRGSISADL